MPTLVTLGLAIFSYLVAEAREELAASCTWSRRLCMAGVEFSCMQYPFPQWQHQAPDRRVVQSAGFSAQSLPFRNSVAFLIATGLELRLNRARSWIELLFFGVLCTRGK